MAKLPSIGKLPAGINVLAQRSLICQTGGSNKFYDLILAEDSNGQFVAGARFGRIGSASAQSVVWYRGPNRASAEDACAQMAYEKVHRGRSVYETADGAPLQPLFPAAPRPANQRHPRPAPPRQSPPQGAAPAAPAVPAARAGSIRDAFGRRRGS